MIKKTQFTGKLLPGVSHQAAQRVDVPARGISYERPERYIVNTPFGQLEIISGDWLVEFSSGNRYIFKVADMVALEHQPKKQWWKLW